MSRKTRGKNPGVRPAPAAVKPVKHPFWLAPLICVFLAGAVWFVFGGTLGDDFVNYDDEAYVYDNSVVAKGLSENSVRWAFTHNVNGNWHPITILSHMLDCQWYGLQPRGHHLTSVALHAAATIVLFAMLWRLTGAPWRSALVAAIFGVHPLRVESVAWIAERKDVLSGLFFMLTLLAYAAYARRRKPGSNAPLAVIILCYGCSLLFFALGLMSKPMLVTVPFVLLLLDYWPLNRFAAGKPPAWLGLVLEKAPFLCLSIIIGVVTLFAQAHAKGVRSFQEVPIPDRVANAFLAYGAYVKQMIFPVNLAVLYPLPPLHPSYPAVALCAVALLIFSAFVFLQRRRRPYLLTGWLWYLGMLLPVIGLIQVGGQAWADRYTYLPQIGLYIMVIWGAAEFARANGWARPVMAVGALAVLAALMIVARAQTGYWKNSFTLWTHALQCAPENAVAHCNLGNVLAEEGRTSDAIAHYKRSVELKPDDVESLNNLGAQDAKLGDLSGAVGFYQRALQWDPDYPAAHNNWAVILSDQGQFAEAIEHFRRALQIRPDYADAEVNWGNALARQRKFEEAAAHFRRAIDLKPAAFDAYNGLGNVFTQQKKWDEARQAYEQVFKLKPDDADAHYNYAIALADEGKPDAAAAQYAQALSIQPDTAKVEANWGSLLGQQQQWAEAARHLERAVALQSNYPEARYNLGIALVKLGAAQATQGKMDEAIEYYERALAANPDFPEARVNLGLALHRTGKTPQALAELQRALDLAVAQNKTALARAIRSQIQLYQPDAVRAHSPSAATAH